ncbi:MAG TPA: WD40 repeat domain-containing protein [Spirillospora sp.]
MGDDGLARLWNTRSGRCVHVFECAGEDCRGDDLLGTGAVALSGDGARLAACFAIDFEVRIWDAATGGHLLTLDPHEAVGRGGWVCDLAFVPGRPSTLAVLHEDRGISMWDVPAGRRSIGPLPGREFADAMRFSRDGTLVATAGHFVAVWDVNTGRGIVGGHTDDCGGTSAVDLSPDARLLATSGHSHGVGYVWDLPTLTRKRGFPTTPGLSGENLLPHQRRGDPAGHGVREGGVLP